MLVRGITMDLICSGCGDEIYTAHLGAISLPIYIRREVKIESPCADCGCDYKVKKIKFEARD